LLTFLRGAAGAASGAGLDDVHTSSVALLPEGGASDVGASVCKYAQEHKVGWSCRSSESQEAWQWITTGF
jgi:hypothetical protein